MITMLGNPRRCCDGLTRRETLTAGALTLLGGAFNLSSLFAAQERRVRKLGRAVEFEDTFEYAGQTHTFLAARFPLPDGAVGGVGADITARKRAEAALKESEERYRALAEAVPPVVWVARADGTVEYINPRWEEFTGRPADDALGDHWLDFLHP